MARPMWSGTIQISLVGFAVEVYPASSTTRPISFHEIDRNTLSRVHRQNVSAGPSAEEEAADPDSEDGNEPQDTAAKHKTSLHIAPMAAEHAPERVVVESDSRHAVSKIDVVKGYEYEKGKYAIVESAELKNLRLAGKRTVEISQFARASEINPALYDKPYFVVPKGGAPATAFAVMRQSMINSGMVGVGEIVFSGRQHLMTLAPPHDPEQPGMMLYTLRFASELRDVHDVSKDGNDIQADAAQLSLAKQLVDAYTQPFHVSKFRDHYEDALRELVEAKINHFPVVAAKSENKRGKVIDLMDALRRSLAQRNPSETGAAGAKSQATAKSETTSDSSPKSPTKSPARTKDVKAKTPAAAKNKRESA